MNTDHTPTSTEHNTETFSNHNTKSVSKLVHYMLLIIGLLAEFFAISIGMEKQIKVSFEKHSSMHFISPLIQIAIIPMLVHQFFIIRNFYKLDHFNSADHKRYGIGDWVTKSFIEDLLRVILFVLFACITGEITYLFIVGSEIHNLFIDSLINSILNLLGKGHVGHDPISWITPFFIFTAFLMSFIMLLWDISGLIYDRKKLPSINFRKYKKDDQIVFYPLNHTYYTFLVSDIFGFIFWLLTLVFVINGNPDIVIIILLFQFFYLIIISLRTIAELHVNIPKMITGIKIYIRTTKL